MDSPPTRDADQEAIERSLKEVGEVLLAIEAALRRIDQALAVVPRPTVAGDPVPVALQRAHRDLDALRRRLQHDAYFDAANPSLF